MELKQQIFRSENSWKCGKLVSDEKFSLLNGVYFTHRWPREIEFYSLESFLPFLWNMFRFCASRSFSLIMKWITSKVLSFSMELHHYSTEGKGKTLYFNEELDWMLDDPQYFRRFSSMCHSDILEHHIIDIWNRQNR